MQQLNPHHKPTKLAGEAMVRVTDRHYEQAIELYMSDCKALGHTPDLRLLVSLALCRELQETTEALMALGTPPDESALVLPR
jgi:hypothetical protein